ncbi:hypothetical protein VB773_03275 [Haloarculaceae archaeon H-GB2-1]|nr:hypothetical protein [Haloarculaceae archaeon H-GB1-1]MEA5388645.1 hypothetical protein [Haloarculaceae archaeon H-GB11]MEA5406698.1 hypothetical protein [Haloarculaceae archaeon H-GB2-1]
MDDVSLAVPQPILESLPEDGANAGADMQRAVEGIQTRINRAIESADDDADATSAVLDVVEAMQDRFETYDEFVPELRAWGQSPIYAIAWRNLYADLIGQLYEHDDLGERLERERGYRIAEDGIRLQDL